MDQIVRTITIGIIATAVMDLWGYSRQPLFGFPRADYRLVGRWFAYMPRGRFHHTSIAASPPLVGEHIVGWVVHYLIGTTFAALLVRVGGVHWLRHPTLGPALVVGIATVAAPLLLMQPGMGAGIAAARTKRPSAARLQAFLTHTVFGLGLYVAAWITQLFVPFAR